MTVVSNLSPTLRTVIIPPAGETRPFVRCCERDGLGLFGFEHLTPIPPR